MDNTQQPEDTNGMVAPDLRLRPPRSPRVPSVVMSNCRACWTKGVQASPNRMANTTTHVPWINTFSTLLVSIRSCCDRSSLPEREMLRSSNGSKQMPHIVGHHGRSCSGPPILKHERPQTTKHASISTEASLLREDIVTWFDLLDLDDYISFGGNA